jgi:hypothetical protein
MLGNLQGDRLVRPPSGFPSAAFAFFGYDSPGAISQYAAQIFDC